MKKQLLPIGSIITVNGQDVMICAYFQKDALINNEKYDYACCLYPSGMGKEAILVKKEQIEKLVFVGFQDSRFVDFKEKMEK